MSKKSFEKFRVEKKESTDKFIYIVIALLFVLVIASIALFFFNVDSKNIEIPASKNFKGNPDAKVRVVEFSDFQCPACGAAYPITKQVFQEFKDKIVFEYRHLPLTSIHENAFIAAIASECAGNQGKFWEYHDKLFESQRKVGEWDSLQGKEVEKKLKEYAQSLNLNSGTFNSCIENFSTQNVIQEDLTLVSKLNVTSTPTFFVNGKKISSYGTLRSEVEAAVNSTN